MLEYDYDVVYIQYIKLVKSMVNIDAFSRNPVNLKESTCKVISLLNPNDPKMQKRSLKCWKNQTGRRGLQSLSVRWWRHWRWRHPPIPFEQNFTDLILNPLEKRQESTESQYKGEMTVHNFSNRRITRSQTKNNNLEQIRSANSQEYTDKILEIKNRNDLPDKGDIEDDERRDDDIKDDERGYSEDEERQNENRNSKDEEIVEEKNRRRNRD